MPEYFLKVKKYDDDFRRIRVERMCVTESELQIFCKNFLFGDVYRVVECHIERLTNEN